MGFLSVSSSKLQRAPWPRSKNGRALRSVGLEACLLSLHLVTGKKLKACLGNWTKGLILRKLSLTQGKFTLLNNVDYAWASQWKWYALRGRGKFYAARNSRTKPKRQHILLHRELLKAPAGFEVDHRNGDGLDNRRKNLRLATTTQNRRNASLSKANTSGYKGVYRSRDKFFARVGEKHLGMFDTPEQAGRAYNKAARVHWGAFAKLNKIGEKP